MKLFVKFVNSQNIAHLFKELQKFEGVKKMIIGYQTFMDIYQMNHCFLMNWQCCRAFELLVNGGIFH